MGCNCGAGGASRQATIAQRSREAAFRAAGSPVGFSAEDPFLIGDEGGDVRRVRVLKPVDGLSIGQAAFVTGAGVSGHLLAGDFHDITRTNQSKRLWKVNGFTYTSWQEANRVAASMGVKPVEVA